MGRGGALLIAGVLVLAGAAAWMVLRDASAPASGERAPGEGAPVASPETTPESDTGERARVGAATGTHEVGDTPDIPTGAIRVVEEDGSIALASVYTTAEPVWVRADAKYLGGTGTYGFVHPEYRDAEPLAYLWALARGRIAGPDAVDPEGQTLTLGPGSSIDVHVRRPDGTPVAGARCGAHGFRGNAVTDATGDAVLSGFPAGIDVEVGATVLGSHGHARAEVALPPDGAPARAELEVDPGAGPFVLVTVSGDFTPRDRIQIVHAGGNPRAQDYTVSVRDPPVLVSLRERAEARVEISARALGYRSAQHAVQDLVRGTTTPIELMLVAGGVPARGRVLNADGSPAAGVAVGMLPGLLEWSDRVTDDEGWFDVRVRWIGGSILALRKREACSPLVALDGDMDELVLRLGAGATLQGTVRDTTSGRPIEKAELRIAFGPEEDDDAWDAETDAAGAYSVSGLPPGTYVLPLIDGSPRAAPPEEQWRLTGGHERSAPAREKLLREGHAHVIQGTETITHDLVAIANRGGECTFRVVLPPGQDVPELFEIEHSMRGPHGWREAREFVRPRDGAPSFTRFLEEGTHVLRVLAPGLFGEGPEIVVTGDGTLPDVEIVMRPRRRVLARLVDAAGTPVTLSGVRIRVAVNGPNGGRSHGAGMTDDDGIADVTNDAPAPGKVDADETFVVFTLDGEGLYTASPWGDDANLRVPGREWARRMREATSETWVLDVPIVQPPQVVLHVIGSSGQPAQGVSLRWKRSFDDDWATGVSDADGDVAIALTDEYNKLEIEATGEWVGGTEIQRMHSRTNETSLTVDRRRTVRVRFVDSSGNALPDQWVIAFVPGVWTERATDAAGCIDLDLAASDTTFQVRAGGFWTPESVAAPSGATEVDAVVEPLFPVTFRVVLPRDLEPPERVFVQVGTSQKPSGDAKFADVVPDKPIEAQIMLPRRAFPVTVSVDNPLFGGTAHYTGVEDEVTVRVERLPLRTVVLRLTDDEGRPIAATLVRIRAFGVLDTELTTDAGGHVRVELPPIALDPVVIAAEGYEEMGWRFDPATEVDDAVTIDLASAR